MLGTAPLYLLWLLFSCKILSYFCASLNYLVLKIGFLNTPAYITKLQNKKSKTLQYIWYAKLARRTISFLVRTPLRKHIIKLVNFNISMPTDQGCIIVMCHTPWKRLLVHWCVEKRFALIVGGGKWDGRRRAFQRQGRGITELRSLVKHLQLGGRIITSADVFNNLSNCSVKFLGKDYNASLFAERLAMLTKVPIITVIPKLSNNVIEFITGPQFQAINLKLKSITITPQIISFFEKEIETNPATWSNYVK